SVAPVHKQLVSGGNTTYTVTAAITAGSAQTVTLSAVGLPAGVTASFNPATITGNGTSTLTLTSGATSRAWAHPFQIPGTAGSLTRIAVGSVTVLGSDFTLAASPGTRTLGAGGTTTYTVDIGLATGNPEPVTLTVSGLPAGVTASFSPNPVTPV